MNIEIDENGISDYKEKSKVTDIEILDDVYFHLVTEGGIYCLPVETTINGENFKLYKPIKNQPE